MENDINYSGSVIFLTPRFITTVLVMLPGTPRVRRGRQPRPMCKIKKYSMPMIFVVVVNLFIILCNGNKRSTSELVELIKASF